MTQEDHPEQSEDEKSGRTAAKPLAPQSLRFHEHRAAIMRETHARPPLSLESPCSITRVTLIPKGGGSQSLAEHAITRVFDQSGQPVPRAEERQVTCTHGARRTTIEQQTELVTITIVVPGASSLTEAALDIADASWISELDAEIVAAIHMLVDRADLSELPERAERLFGRNGYAAFAAGHGPVAAATDFTPSIDGFVRILMLDAGATPAFIGRTAQRILEAEGYRTAAMLALPEAQRLLTDLATIEGVLDVVVTRLASPPHMSNDRNLLIEVSRIAGQVEELGHRTGYRFGAARAYHQLVLERFDQLHEVRIADRQRFSSFVNRRLAPAMRTCEAADRRRKEIAERVTQAIDLLRARVNVAMEEQNARLLVSLDQRSAAQLRLQETVEGLSVIAVSYYAVGLAHYLAKGLAASGVAINPDLAAGLSAPIIVGLAAFSLHRIKSKIRESRE